MIPSYSDNPSKSKPTYRQIDRQTVRQIDRESFSDPNHASADKNNQVTCIRVVTRNVSHKSDSW